MPAFARHLGSIVLDTNVVGARGISALLAGDLPALTDLGLAQTLLGDDGCQALAEATSPVTRLRLMGNRISSKGIAELLAAPFAGQLTQLALHHNRIGDEGCELVARSERLGSLQRLSMGGTGATDKTIVALVEGPHLGRLVLLNLFDNRISDAAAVLLAQAKPAALEILVLARCGLTKRGMKALAQLDLKTLNVAGQDPSKLPPHIAGAPALVFEILDQGPAKTKTPPVPAELRAMYGHPNFIGIGLQPEWAFALDKIPSGYNVAMVEVATRRVVKPEPPVEGPYFSYEFSPDGRWCGVMAPFRAVYVIDTQTGESTRLADSLDHQKSGVAWSDGCLVVLDCDTQAGWQGRLEVYAHDEQLGWQREHQVGGFWCARDSIDTIAGGRIIAIGGHEGAFLVALRGDQLRYLGQLPIQNVNLYEVDGRSYVTVKSHTYEMTNIDEALDLAFADTAQLVKLDLGKKAWR